MDTKKVSGRLTKRDVIEAGNSETMPPGTPDKVLIHDELLAIKELADSVEGDLEVPWGDKLKLDEDDWILRQIFEISGLNPRRMGHWRLLLGILAEFQIDPSRPDNLAAFYSAAAVSSTRWTPDERHELLKQASQIAARLPKLSRQAISALLANDPRWKRSGTMWQGQKNKPTAIRSVLEAEIKASRERIKNGSLHDDPKRESILREMLTAFKQHKNK